MPTTTAHITHPYQDTPVAGFPQVWTVTVTAHAHFDNADDAAAFHANFKPIEDTLIDPRLLLDSPKSANAAASTRARRKSGTKQPPPTPKYSQEIHMATARARAIGGRTWWPTPVDHLHARQRITEALAAEGKEPTRGNVLALTGTTMTALRKIANMQAPRSELSRIAHVSSLMDDASARGRNLAAIIIVWCDELPR
jgi:hypothetical protein